MHTSSELPPAFFTLALFTSPWCRRQRHTTRYYAFISKYLDSTDLLLLFVVLPLPPPFLRALLAFYRFASLTAHTSPVRCPSALVFPSHTHTLSLSRSHPLLLLHCSLLTCAFGFSSLFTSLRRSGSSSSPQHTLAALRTCQSRAAVAATPQILDTQYPSCSGRPLPDTDVPTQLRRSCNENGTRKRHWIRALDVAVQTAVVSSSNLSTSSLPALAQLTTTPETLIETNQLNYPS